MDHSQNSQHPATLADTYLQIALMFSDIQNFWWNLQSFAFPWPWLCQSSCLGGLLTSDTSTTDCYRATQCVVTGVSRGYPFCPLLIHKTRRPTRCIFFVRHIPRGKGTVTLPWASWPALGHVRIMSVTDFFALNHWLQTTKDDLSCWCPDRLELRDIMPSRWTRKYSHICQQYLIFDQNRWTSSIDSSSHGPGWQWHKMTPSETPYTEVD